MMNKLTLVFYLMILSVSLSLLPNTSKAQTTPTTSETVYVDQPFIPNLMEIENWISKKVKADKVGYCYKSYISRDEGYVTATNTCPPGDYPRDGLCKTPCPTGYTDRIDICFEDCPPGYVDAGICWRAGGDYSAPTILADCPTGYINTVLLGCHRLYSSFEAPSRLADCPAGYTNMGLTCYVPWSIPVDDFPLSSSRATCPPGYFKSFAGRCYDDCSGYPGYTNIGEFCAREANSLSVDYATCPVGYHKAIGITTCEPNCKHGFHNFGLTCFADSLTYPRTSWPNPLHGHLCPEGYVRDVTNPVGYCYRPCPTGYYGELGSCYQNCPSGWVTCGLGCAKDEWTCTSETIGQITSVFTVAANIISLGMTTSVSSATGLVVTSIKLGSKVFVSGSSRADLFIKVIKGLQSYQTFGPGGMIQPVNVLKRFQHKAFPFSRPFSEAPNFTVSLPQKMYQGGKNFIVASALNAKGFYDAVVDMKQAMGHDFVELTSQGISDIIDANYDNYEADFIKQYYANTMLAEIQANVEFGLVQDALSVVAMMDPTGLVDLVNSYNHPTCNTLNLTLPTKPTIIYGNGVPDAGVGAEGNYYVNTDPNLSTEVNNTFGPKKNGTWPVWVPNY